jgi:hypothetical protein
MLQGEKNYCPNKCSGGERIAPGEVTPERLARIRTYIIKRKYPPLPQLMPGEKFYICFSCNCVWKASSRYSTDRRNVLGVLSDVGDREWISAI